MHPHYFCSCKLRWRSTECVLLSCFNALPDVFAVINCSVSWALSAVFCSSLLTLERWYYVHYSDTLYNNQYGECVQNNMHVISINFAKTLVRKREYDVILWRRKERIYSNNDHHKPLLNTKILYGGIQLSSRPGHHQISAPGFPNLFGPRTLFVCLFFFPDSKLTSHINFSSYQRSGDSRIEKLAAPLRGQGKK